MIRPRQRPLFAPIFQAASLCCLSLVGPARAAAQKSPPPVTVVRPVGPASVAAVPAPVSGLPGPPGAATGDSPSHLANPPVASTAAGGAMPLNPAPELDQMKVLEGSWRCDGRAPSTATAPEHAYRSTWKFKRDLDNFWWVADYQQLRAKTNPAPMKARGFMTYEPGSHSFTLVGVDNSGGTTHETTSGWNGEVVTLAGEATLAGKKVPFREVITRRGEREFTWRGEMKVAGDWMTLGEDRCRK